MSDHQSAKPRGHYYTPATVIKLVAGVVKQECPNSNVYTGTADALVASGLVALDLLPGQPGRPTTTINLRPSGVKREQGECWHQLRGYTQIYRKLNSEFRIVVRVSRDEQERRNQLLPDRQRRRGVALVCASLTPAPRLPHLRLVWSA